MHVIIKPFQITDDEPAAHNVGFQLPEKQWQITVEGSVIQIIICIENCFVNMYFFFRLHER